MCRVYSLVVFSSRFSMDFGNLTLQPFVICFLICFCNIILCSSYRDGKVFTLSSSGGPCPGTSGLTSRDIIKTRFPHFKKTLSTNTLNPLHMEANCKNELEDGIEPFEEVSGMFIVKMKLSYFTSTRYIF